MRNYLLIFLVIPPFSAGAEEPRHLAADSGKTESIPVMQRQVVGTIKNDPLADKRFGLEVNVIRMLYWGKEASFSAGFSLFNVDRNAEVAFPFFYAKTLSEANEVHYGTSKLDFMEITQDVQYRYFPGNAQNGFYLSAFARFAFMEGVLGDIHSDGSIWDDAAESQRSSEGKLGGGFGLGYRIFTYTGIYWGCGLAFGRYFIGDHDRFRGGFFPPMDADEEFIFDVELLKFGWAF